MNKREKNNLPSKGGRTYEQTNIRGYIHTNEQTNIRGDIHTEEQSLRGDIHTNERKKGQRVNNFFLRTDRQTDRHLGV